MISLLNMIYTETTILEKYLFYVDYPFFIKYYKCACLFLEKMKKLFKTS
jgi:hypothetical protein